MPSAYPPDGVTVGSGSWGNDLDQESSVIYSGSYSVIFKPTTPASDPWIRTDKKETFPGDVWQCDFVARADSVAAGDTVAAFIEWYTAASAYISTDYIYAAAVLPTADTWYTLSGTKTAPATAALAHIGFLKKNTGFSAYIDTMGFRRVRPSFYAYLSADYTASNPTEVIPFASERFDYGSWFDTANYQAVVPTDGEYVFQAQAQAVDIDADEYCYLYLLLDRGGSTYLLAIGHKHYAINANEQPFVGVSWIGAAQRGDKVSVIFAHDHPVSTDVNGDAGSVANLTWFSGFKL